MGFAQEQMDENLVGHFYDKLVSKESQPGVILTQLYCTYYGKESTVELIKFFARMVKLYGRNLVFESLLELFDIPDVTHDTIDKLIAYLIRHRFKDQTVVSETVDLSGELERFNKEVKAAGKQKLEGVKDPFNDKS